MRVSGFKASAAKANIKYKDRLDLGVIFSEVSCVTSAFFTQNLVKAAPVLDSITLLKESDSFKAIVVNSGNANACTGQKGLDDCKTIRKQAADFLKCAPEQILVCSTGVIGAHLPMENYLKGLKEACSHLSEEGLVDVSEAILTTDTRPKVAAREIQIEKNTIHIFGMAKGAGMIAPQMAPHATMLAFILTDAVVEPSFWKHLTGSSVEKTFNRISVDGDMSTNDTVIAMANGMARNIVLDGEDDTSSKFSSAVYDVMRSLSEQIVMDGEGATKCVELIVTGAGNEKEAELCARAISNSPLVKTAFFGEDPNWGRIIAACGYSGARFRQEDVNIFINNVQLVKGGISLGDNAEKAAKVEMKKNRFSVKVDLGAGDSTFEMLTCDLSTEYIHINADYRT